MCINYTMHHYSFFTLILLYLWTQLNHFPISQPNVFYPYQQLVSFTYSDTTIWEDSFDIFTLVENIYTTAYFNILYNLRNKLIWVLLRLIYLHKLSSEISRGVKNFYFEYLPTSSKVHFFITFCIVARSEKIRNFGNKNKTIFMI